MDHFTSEVLPLLHQMGGFAPHPPLAVALARARAWSGGSSSSGPIIAALYGGLSSSAPPGPWTAASSSVKTGAAGQKLEGMRVVDPFRTRPKDLDL